MIGKARSYQVQHIAGDCIRREVRMLRRLHRFRQPLAILRVEIPAPACRGVAFHQEIGLAPHLAVEEFHPQFAAVFRPCREARAAGEKTVVLADVDGNAEAFLPRLHIREHAPFAGKRDDDTLCAMPRHGALQFAEE